MSKTKPKHNPVDTLTDKQLAELQAIDRRLNAALAERRAGNHNRDDGLSVEKSFGAITFRYETVRCGKPNCTRCPHGPYWYAYWKENGRTRSRYIGRTLPAPARASYEQKRQARLQK